MSPAAPLSGPQRSLVTIAAIAAMVMQVLDTTIANVALPHMQTSLGATRETVNWVLTSYIVAAAIATTVTGWLAERIGRKRLFVGAVVTFTIASLLCAIAQNLGQMVAFRILQGVAGAFLSPLAQSVMLDINPPERHGRAMAVFGAGVMIGPIMGPVLGGWLTESFNWRWVFLVNLPVGILSALLMIRYMPSTATLRRGFDLLGFAFLALAVGALQMMLDRGEQLDWFASWEIWVEAGLAIAGAWLFAVHMATARNPLFEPALFRDVNLVLGILFMTVIGLMLLAGLALLPPLLQGLFGYSVLQTGLLTAPRGVGTLVSMIVVGRLAARVDARLLVLAGLGLMALSLWMMTGFSLEMDERPVIVSGLVQGFALGFLFVPMNVIAFGTLPARLRTTGSSLLNLSRSIGGSVGISLTTTLLARNLQVSHADLAAHVTQASLPPVSPVVGAARPVTEMAAAMIDAEINRQALMISYLDDFHAMMIVALCAIPLVALLRRPPRRGAARPPMAD